MSYLLETSNSFTSTSSNFAISKKVSIVGCISFVHQRDTVDLSLPVTSASHFDDFSFSARTIFILLYFCLGMSRRFRLTQT